MRRKDDEKQQRIKRAVMQVSLEEGFSGTSISKIAKHAGVSPATVYVYYASKEQMLKDIYVEYSEDVYGYLVQRVRANMSGPDMVESLMRSYYTYIGDHRDILSFVEQFSHCPSLAYSCSGKSNACLVFGLFDQLKQRGEVPDCNCKSLFAVIFSPVRQVAENQHVTEAERQDMLDDVVALVKRALF